MNVVFQSDYTPFDNEMFAKDFLKNSDSKAITAFKKASKLIFILGGFVLVGALFIGSFWISFEIAAILVFWGIYYARYPKKVVKSVTEQNRVLLGSRNMYAFYDDYYYEKTETPLQVRETSQSYNMIRQIDETPTHFFLYTENTCNVVPKRNMSPENIAELSFFFSSFFPQKYKRCIV